MPINTGFGVLSTGKDVAADVVLSSGRHLILSNITGFDAKPKSKKLQSLGIDGITRSGVIPESWTLSFDLDRADSKVDDWWADYEAAYFAGDTIENCTILETITEADGSITQYRFEGVALALDDAGLWRADQFVKQKVSGEASKRVKVQ